MKSQVVEKNGFPKPKGLMLIFLMISLVCLIQCSFSETANANTTGKKIDFPGVEEEAEIQIEEWMVNESFWNNEYISEFPTEESEPEISIKPWMVNLERFDQELANSNPEIEIEEWMLNDSYWLVSTSTYYTQNEDQKEEVKFEKWMYNENFWGDGYYTRKAEEGN